MDIGSLGSYTKDFRSSQTYVGQGTPMATGFGNFL